MIHFLRDLWPTDPYTEFVASLSLAALLLVIVIIWGWINEGRQ